MSDGIAALLGAVIGGALVVLGDLIARRAERKNEMRSTVLDNAADLLSFEWHRHALAQEHRRGTAINIESLRAVHERERRRAGSFIFLSPVGAQLSRPMRDLMSATSDLVEAADASEEDWKAAEDRYLTARSAFEGAVRNI